MPCPEDGQDVTTDNWAEYNNGLSCGENCAFTGCRRDGACALSSTECESANGGTGDKYCNLCFDRECAKCTTYDDECEVCNVSGHAYLDGD